MIEDFSTFLYDSPTPFHAVANAKDRLLRGGFIQLHEENSWDALRKSQPGQGFFCLRSGSLIAWLCGSVAPWEEGSSLRMAGAHSDSPALKLKLESARWEHGVLSCHLSVYGSPIYATHLDRSLGVAGIAVTDKRMRLLHTRHPIALIPNLAIHLNREANSKLAYNPQTQLKAVFDLQGGVSEGLAKEKFAQVWLRQHLGLEDGEACELQLCSTEAIQVIGLQNELLSGARLDDMSMVYLLLDCLLWAKQKNYNGNHWPMAIFCNGEEVGSRTYEGAASNFISSVLQRLLLQHAGRQTNGNKKARATRESAETWGRTQARSFFLSLDGAHASHPSYPEAFDPDYDLKMGGGPALKIPNGASYSSEPFGIAHIQAVAQKVGCHLQHAVPRSDKPTGSTIGPILTSQLGVRGVDLGLPMYAMHSLQETVALRDYQSLQALVREYYLPS